METRVGEWDGVAFSHEHELRPAGYTMENLIKSIFIFTMFVMCG
jgi:hypothetical protein